MPLFGFVRLCHNWVGVHATGVFSHFTFISVVTGRYCFDILTRICRFTVFYASWKYKLLCMLTNNTTVINYCLLSNNSKDH